MRYESGQTATTWFVRAQKTIYKIMAYAPGHSSKRCVQTTGHTRTQAGCSTVKLPDLGRSGKTRLPPYRPPGSSLIVLPQKTTVRPKKFRLGADSFRLGVDFPEKDFAQRGRTTHIYWRELGIKRKSYPEAPVFVMRYPNRHPLRYTTDFQVRFFRPKK